MDDGIMADEGGLAHLGGFEALHDEYSYTVPRSEIRGRVPDSVRGTFLRIGPGRNRIGSDTFGHWFDGDGMMHALTFSADGAWYRNRYVRTPKYRKETAAGRIVCRSFGHNAPGGMLRNIGRPPANAAKWLSGLNEGMLCCLSWRTPLGTIRALLFAVVRHGPRAMGPITRKFLILGQNS